jgi:hypothetical protein
VDVVCCSELALLSCARSRPDHISFDALCTAAAEGLDPPLLEVRLDLYDEICLRGPAVVLPDRAADGLDWQTSGLKIERNGSVFTGIA